MPSIANLVLLFFISNMLNVVFFHYDIEEAETQENETLLQALQEKEVRLQEIVEAKTQETEKLKHALQEMQHQFQEIKEAKTHETEKLQHDLQEMKLQFQETKAVLIQEQAAKKVVEQPPTMQVFLLMMFTLN